MVRDGINIGEVCSGFTGTAVGATIGEVCSDLIEGINVGEVGSDGMNIGEVGSDGMNIGEVGSDLLIN